MNFLSRKFRRAAAVAAAFPRNLCEPPVAVLLYHRVAIPGDDPHQLAVSPDNFRRHLEFLRDRFPVIRFGGTPGFRRFSVALTFDDGYADNLENALPILREFDLPATFFVSSGYLDGRAPYPWDGAFAPGRRPMTADELRELDADPLAEVGAHTRTHRRLSELAPAAQFEEIDGGRRELEAVLGHPVPTFSYPFGNRADFNADSVAACRRAGFRRAAANFPGQWHSDTDPFRIPRHIVRDWSAPELARRIPRFRFL